MRIQKVKTRLNLTRQTAVFAAIMVITGSAASVPIARAATLQEQINALSADNAAKQNTLKALKIEADSYQGAINALQAQIDALQAQINANEVRNAELQVQITQAEADLARQKELLGKNIKAMYLEGDISTIEMLATSNNLSDFFDKQQYRDVVKSKIKTTLDAINVLKAKLKDQKTEVENLIKQQQELQAQTAAQRAEQSRLLNMNVAEQAEYNAQIKGNNVRIAELKRQQAIENARLFGQGNVPPGSQRGGGYPEVWASAPLDAMLDNWGMYTRECVSYTAWRVYASGRYMPGWGWQGRGNANQWDDNARAAGIPVDSYPREGDVAVSNAGYYGHVMYVELVDNDGSIYVSDYNQQFDGLYREYWISAATVRARNLVFIHFP